MPAVTVSDEATLYYELEGKVSDPVLVFSNSLGTILGMWDGQAAAFKDRFRILRYDNRGQGQSKASSGAVLGEFLERNSI